MKVKNETAEGAPLPDSTEEWLTHPPQGHTIMSNIMQGLTTNNDRTTEQEGEAHQSARPVVIQDYRAVNLGTSTTTPNSLSQDATAFYAQTPDGSAEDLAQEAAPHTVTRRWKRKANAADASPNPSAPVLNIEQANPNVGDRTYGPENHTPMSFQERAAEYARVYGGITTQEQAPQPAQNTHTNYEPGPGEIHRGDPLIYCCFFLRKGHCRWGDRCRYQHFRSYQEMDPILKRHQIFGLCHRQIPGNFKYPCKRHHHARYA